MKALPSTTRRTPLCWHTARPRLMLTASSASMLATPGSAARAFDLPQVYAIYGSRNAQPRVGDRAALKGVRRKRLQSPLRCHNRNEASSICHDFARPVASREFLIGIKEGAAASHALSLCCGLREAEAGAWCGCKILCSPRGARQARTPCIVAGLSTRIDARDDATAARGMQRTCTSRWLHHSGTARLAARATGLVAASLSHI